VAGFTITLVIERGDNPPELLELRPPIGTMIEFEERFGVSTPATDPKDGVFWRHVAWLVHREDAPDDDYDEWIRTVRLSASDEDIAELRAAAVAVELLDLDRPTVLPLDTPDRTGAPVTREATGGTS
jgi:hypothetical protein